VAVSISEICARCTLAADGIRCVCARTYFDQVVLPPPNGLMDSSPAAPRRRAVTIFWSRPAITAECEHKALQSAREVAMVW